MTFTIKRWKTSSAEAKFTKCFLFEPSGGVSLSGRLLIALLCSHFECEGFLVQTPTNTIVIANQSTFFNCSKSFNESGELTWSHHSLDGKLNDVYEDGKIRGTYRGRFDIDTNSLTSGTFNLLVQEAEPNYAGRYECVENRLKKDKGASAELTVLDSNLVCKSDKDLNEIVGPTQCDKPIAPDKLHLSCSVTYSGNITPQMQWKKVDSELQSIETECGVSGNSIMCNATLEVNLNMDGSAYICQIITAEHYNCSLEVNKTIYIFSDTLERAYTTTEEAFCFANTSGDLPCLYNWHKDNKIEHVGQTLKPNTTGMYRCEAECTIRNETCAFTATVINVSEPEASNAGLIAGLTVGLLFIIGVIIFVAIVARRRHTNIKKENGKNSGKANKVPLVGITSAENANKLPLLEKTSPENANKEPLVGKTLADCGSSKPQTVTPPENIQLLPRTDGNKNTETDYAVEDVFNNAKYIDKGLYGDIHGPVQYKDKSCVVEKIQCAISNSTKVDIISGNVDKWKAFQHGNLRSIYALKILSSEQATAIFIVMDYAAGGSVREALQKRNTVLPIEVVKDWATQIAKGMAYLHEEGIVHRNLNSVQVLIIESLGETDIWNKTLKISHFLLNDESHSSSQHEEKCVFLAPDALNNKYSKESDVWSYGVLVWEILTKQIPYDGHTYGAIMKGILEGTLELSIPESCPPGLCGMLKDCFDREPKKRPSFSQILKQNLLL